MLDRVELRHAQGLRALQDGSEWPGSALNSRLSKLLRRPLLFAGLLLVWSGECQPSASGSTAAPENCVGRPPSTIDACSLSECGSLCGVSNAGREGSSSQGAWARIPDFIGAGCREKERTQSPSLSFRPGLRSYPQRRSVLCSLAYASALSYGSY